MDVVIIEDEFLAVKNLQAIFKEIGNIKVVATFETIDESVDWFNTNAHPDLVFMDIHLADGSAFEIFERTVINCPVIFTTAYDEYAIRAFKVNSIDYLLKPIDKNAMLQAILKFRNLSAMGGANAEIQKLTSFFKQKVNYTTSFLVSAKSDKLIPLPVERIAFFFIDSGITKTFTFDGTKYNLDNALEEVENMLDPSLFFRANRQFIINRNAIEDVDLWFNGRLSVNLKVKVPERILISKAKSASFKEWLTAS